MKKHEYINNYTKNFSLRVSEFVMNHEYKVKNSNHAVSKNGMSDTNLNVLNSLSTSYYVNHEDTQWRDG